MGQRPEAPQVATARTRATDPHAGVLRERSTLQQIGAMIEQCSSRQEPSLSVLRAVAEPVGPTGPSALATAALLLVTSRGYSDAADRVEQWAKHADVRSMVGFDMLCHAPGMDAESAERVCRGALCAAVGDVAEWSRQHSDLDWDQAIVTIGSAVRLGREESTPLAPGRRRTARAAHPSVARPARPAMPGAEVIDVIVAAGG
jgi:hypothetical protein